MTTAGRRLALAFISLTAFACKAKTDAFYEKVFPCSGLDSLECGKTRDGKPMTCVSATALGGGAFCAETCDLKDASTVPDGFVCTAAGALLQACTPNGDAGVDAGARECPASLSCYRTSLSENRGVCLALRLCESESQCSPGQLCAGTVIKGVLPTALKPALSTDHLHCVSRGCRSGVSCPAGQECIGASLGFGDPIDDLCVPSCHSNQDCPPNFTCLRDPTTAPGGPHLCFPGMMGARCSTAQNCLVGACTNVGVEFNVCSTPCQSNEQCGALNSDTDVFVCANGRCVTPRPFQGANCSRTGEGGAVCPPGLECFVETIYDGLLNHGECRVPCGADNECPSRGGLPHVCLGAAHDGGCFPSSFGTPCETTADCIANFQCLPAGGDSHANTNYSPRICTIACDTDADCDADTWTKKGGYCSSEHICRLSSGLGRPCQRAYECASRRCEKNTCEVAL